MSHPSQSSLLVTCRAGAGPRLPKPPHVISSFTVSFPLSLPSVTSLPVPLLSPLPVSVSRLFLAFGQVPRLSLVVSSPSPFLTLPVTVWFREHTRPGMNKHNPGPTIIKRVLRPSDYSRLSPRLGKPTRARRSPSRESSSPVLSFPVISLLDVS